MDQSELNAIVNLGAAMLAGALIGLERSYHGRPAGFRTHTLVALASALLMLVTLDQHIWVPDNLPLHAINADPVRMAQGIMTGIGFLGAGVIFKEGMSVRGLTTAASLWLTSAIGIVMGVGLHLYGALATIAALVILTLFQWVETRLPTESYFHNTLKFARQNAMNQAQIEDFLRVHGFALVSVSHNLVEDAKFVQYGMVISTTRPKESQKLAAGLLQLPSLVEFKLSPPND